MSLDPASLFVLWACPLRWTLDWERLREAQCCVWFSREMLCNGVRCLTLSLQWVVQCRATQGRLVVSTGWLMALSPDREFYSSAPYCSAQCVHIVQIVQYTTWTLYRLCSVTQHAAVVQWRVQRSLQVALSPERAREKESKHCHRPPSTSNNAWRSKNKIQDISQIMNLIMKD